MVLKTFCRLSLCRLRTVSILLGFACLPHLPIYGQTPSPDGAQFSRNISLPVNLYSGIASVSVPLYYVPEGSIGIGLQYNASGIKVRDVASAAGLGWELAAGGMITRMVRGLPDTPTNFMNTSGSQFSKIRNVYDGNVDGEKDIYYYSFPGGSGSFYLNNTTGVPFPWDDISIAYISTTQFEIVDAFGSKYTYTNPDVSNPSSWYLSRIHHLDKPATEDILFTYDTPIVMYDSYTTYAKTVKASNCSQTTFIDVGAEESFPESGADIVLNVKRISVPGKYNVDFIYNGSRVDHSSARKIDYMKVTGADGTEILRYKFYTSYFNAGDSFFKNDSYSDLNGACVAQKCYRLRLDSLVLTMNGQNLTFRKFSYTNDKSFHPTYGYDQYELPPRDSEYFDDWGYFSGGTHQGTIYEKYPQMSMTGTYGTVTYPGMKRSPSAYASANMLSKVTYPEGGYSTFSYQPHQTVGGVRIYQVINYDENEAVISGKTYTYSGEEKMLEPRYYSDVGNSSLNCGVTLNIDEFRIYSSSKRSVFNPRGPQVGYDVVTETDLKGNGYVKHYFVNFTDRVENPAVKYKYTLNTSSGTQGAAIATEESPFVSTNYEVYDRGFEYQTEVFDAQGALLSSSLVELWSPVTIYSQPNLVLADPLVNGSVVSLRVAEYSIVTKPVRVYTVTQSVHDGARAVSTTKTFYYHSTFKTLVNQLNTQDAEGNLYKATYRFPGDIITNGIGVAPSNEVSALNGLKTAKAYGIPIESKTALKKAGEANFYVLGASLNTQAYNVVSGNSYYAPYKTYSLALSVPASEASIASTALTTDKNDLSINTNFRLTGTVNSYDDFGNPTSVTGADGISVSSIYDAGGDYLLSTDVQGRITSYQYYPMVGVKKITDPNGRSVNYEYDAFNRLRMVKNHEGHIEMRKRYHYAIQDEDMASSITCVGTRKPNTTLVFGSNNQAAYYGTTTYLWDFGDGTVEETESETFNHQYSAVGNYTVKLTLLNPEYDPIQVTGIITITPTGGGGGSE